MATTHSSDRNPPHAETWAGDDDSNNNNNNNGWGAYGGNPMAHALSRTESARLPAFGGSFQPGLYKPPPFKFGNPVPMGLSGFALTTFVLSLINLGVLDIDDSALVIGPAYIYGGLIQILAGMWEMALGNNFGASALTSYGGFWIGIAIILTPGFGVEDAYASEGEFYAAFGLYIFGWFVFTFLLWLVTLKSTLAFSMLFMTVWLTYLCLGIAYLEAPKNGGSPTVVWERAGGGFGIIAGFLAWWNMYAGLAEEGNTVFNVPVLHFPWSEKGRLARGKVSRSGDDGASA